jgi:hypothetical protein
MSRIVALAARARGHIASLAGPLREAARGEPRRRRVAWAAVALVLVVVPLGFNLARESSYSVSIDLFPRSVDGYPAVREPAYYRAFLSDGELAKEMRRNVAARPAEYRDAAIRRTGRPGRLVLSLAAGTPARATDLVNALGPQVAGASRRQLGRQAGADAGRLRARLDAGGPSTRARRRLRRELRAAERLRDEPVERIVLGQPATVPQIRGWADKVADAMPGAFRGRPSPVWAGLAGLLVAATLWLIALALLPPGRRRSHAPAP